MIPVAHDPHYAKVIEHTRMRGPELKEPTTMMKELAMFVALGLAAQLAAMGVVLWLLLPLPT